ncbi:class I SAM-dependent RNA methyltransferase [Smaragdicoccus niigatensis]|uniref:class I SAM-dependent RNA methyltransferase n=1 Tax=Smaragdicoccus niigatensis TaxID=359359 RepID=UPI00036B5D3E|nr:TRAM domain-containing protein [Smaragdicoccus niigatensis]
MTDWYGQRFEVELGNPAHGGLCVARHEGRVIFVHGGLPGERVAVDITEDRGKSFCRADVIEVIEASKDRVAPVCAAAAAGSGCCDLAHAEIGASRSIKAFVVAEQLRRLAHIDWTGAVEALPGRSDGTGYRTRVRLAVGADGHAGFRKYRGSEVVSGVACAQPVAGLLDGIADRRFAVDTEVVAAFDDDGTQHVIADRRVVKGNGRAVQRVAGRRWEVSASGFWQAHSAAASTYSDVVAGWAGSPATAWDLYAGVGVFAARLAEGGANVVAIEFGQEAVRDGAIALEDLPIHFITARTEVGLRKVRGTPDVVVLDPPRKGTGKEVARLVTAHRPGKIIQIGCDPASFARDLGLFQELGYRIDEIRAFDAFPLTHHMECLASLTPATA